MVKKMIEKALKYIVGLGEARTQAIHGDTYSDKELYRIDKHIPTASPISMNTLSSLVNYIKGNIDSMSEKMIVHVVSPEEVMLFSCLNDNRKRETLVSVKAQVPSFPYESFTDHERFVIAVQSKFLDDPETDKALLMKFAGTVEAGTIANYGDDGVTQKATVSTGIASKSDAIVPNPVKLRPFRTFVEVEQPVSEFIFRIKQDKYEGIKCAIFEADGGAWKNAAMKNIKDYLDFELADYKDQFVVIS